MISYPNAKINLGLNVLSRRQDGYHNITSFFLPIPLCDILEFNLNSSYSNKTQITYSGITFPNIERDLVLQAYDLLDNDFNLPAIKIHLHKCIPFAAGLGGGSSNAVSMLKMLNQFFKLNLNKTALLKYAMILGSDCSFFLYNSFSQVSGVGQYIKELDFSFKDYYILLVKPNFAASTALIFSKLQLNKNNNSVLNLSQDANMWKKQLFNDLETVTFSMYPELRVIKKQLYALGAIYASMSGSGSCIYGVFNKKPIVGNIFQNYWVWQGNLG